MSTPALTEQSVTRIRVLGYRPAGAAAARERWLWWAAVFAAHAILGLAMHTSVAVASLHAFVTLAAALAFSLTTRRSLNILLCGAYVTASEVLWRMCDAMIFHEMGKYAVAFGCLLGMIRLKKPRIPFGPLLYFCLLLPAVVVPYFTFSFDVFRKAVLFNLSGPLSLFFVAVFSSNLRLPVPDVLKIVPVFCGPAAAVAAITVFSTYSNRAIRFSNESNFAASGGFGPNQVSSTLAMGTLFCMLYIMLRNLRGGHALLYLGMALVMTAQSVMTFSRSGIFAVLITMAVVTPLLLPERRSRRRAFAIMAVFAVFGLAAFPVLNAFTGGKLAQRFSDIGVSHREQIAVQDIEMWKRYPVFGVGVGISKYGHTGGMAAHTEFSRLLAEHGTLGLAALLTLAAMILHLSAGALQRSARVRGLRIALMSWAVLYMLSNGMRTVLPGFVFGLGCADFSDPERDLS